MKKRCFFSLWLFILFNYTVSSQTQDTIRLYFAFDKSEVMQSANIQNLDSLYIEISKNIPSSIDIIGYADIKGSKEYNIKLSSERANNVREYLIKKGIQEKFIGLCEGRGAISSSTKNNTINDQAKCRRVDVICKRTKLTPAIEQAHSYDSLSEIVNLNIGERFILKNLNFNPGSDILLYESLPTLRKLLTILLENPSLKIRIEGHICCDQGNINSDVSTKRARKIYYYLIQNGVSSDRLSFIGLGRNYPLVDPEVTEEDRMKNRRVEILIVDK